MAATACSGADDGRTSVYSAGSGDLRGSVYPEPLPRPDFTFTDTAGEPYPFLGRTEGKLTFLFFGFTTCPDVCPVHMSGLAAALGELPFEDRAKVEVVFVTIDPERDTPDRIREWLDAFDPSFVGLTAPLDQANAVLGELLMGPASHIAREDSGYDVVHPAAVVAFSPDGPARVRYPFGTRRADWSHDVPRLLDGS